MPPKGKRASPCTQRLKAYLLSKYGGSGDPELSDGLHCVDHFQQHYRIPDNFLQLLMQVMDRIQQCDPAWMPPECIKLIPLAPKHDEPAFEGWAHPWQFGYKESQALRGKPKMVHILSVCNSILDQGCFKSQSNPLSPLFPVGHIPGSPITPFSMMHSVGMTKSLSLKCLLEAVSCCGFNDAEFRSILSMLKSCVCIKFIYEPAESEDEQMELSLVKKFQISESTRPDVLQLYHLFKIRLGKRDEKVSPENIKNLVDAYNAQISVESYKISEAETHVLLMFPGMTDAFMNALDYHWHNYKASESAVPLKLLATPENFSVKIEGAPGVWMSIYQPHPDKDTFCLLGHIGIYAKHLKEALRLRKKFKGQNFRRGGDNNMLYRMSCVWVHFRPDFQQRLSASEFEELEKMFFRGTLERELKDKVGSENPTLSVNDFRFVENFSGNVQQQRGGCQVAWPLDDSMHDDGISPAQVEAEEEQERSALRLLSVKLQRDTDKWDNYLEKSKDFENKTKAQRRRRAAELKDQLKDATEAYCNLKVPVFCMEDDTAFASKVAGATGTFLEENVITASNAFYFYWVDYTKLGSSFSAVMNKAVRLVADAIAHNPSNTGAMIIAPNIATRGAKYDDLAIEAAHDDIEVLLKNESLELHVRRSSIVFSQDQSCRSRPVSLPCWNLMSNALDDKGALLSAFASSKLFQQKGVTDISRQQEVDFVNPTALIFRGGDDFSRSQRLKQEVTGKDLYLKVRDALWIGMKLSPKTAGICIDVFGYDDSFTESIIVASLKHRPKAPTEMLVTTIWAKSDVEGDQRKRQAKWLREAQRRFAGKMVMDKVLKLEGVVVDDNQVPTQRPSYNTDEFLLTMPTADESLALRQSKLDEYTPKFTRLQEDFQALMAKHDAKYNPSGVPYKGQGKRSADVIEDADAVSFPEASVIDSKDKLEELGTIHTCASFQPDVFELMVTHTGNLYIHALADGVASDQMPLCHIHGKYLTGAEVDTYEKACKSTPTKKKGTKDMPLMKINITDEDFMGMWAVPSSWPTPFSTAPKPLSEFLDFLLNEKNVTEPGIVCHKLEVTAEGETKITQETPCAFLPLVLPQNYKADRDNIGSLLDIASMNLDFGETDDQVALYSSWHYEDSNRNKGISPLTPAFFFGKPRRVIKGKCYLVF